MCSIPIPRALFVSEGQCGAAAHITAAFSAVYFPPHHAFLAISLFQWPMAMSKTKATFSRVENLPSEFVLMKNESCKVVWSVLACACNLRCLRLPVCFGARALHSCFDLCTDSPIYFCQRHVMNERAPCTRLFLPKCVSCVLHCPNEYGLLRAIVCRALGLG